MDPLYLRFALATFLLLLPALSGCATAGKVAAWTVKETATVAIDLTLFTAKTTISLATDTTGYAAKKGIDTALDVATHLVADEIVREGVESAVEGEATPARGNPDSTTTLATSLGERP